MTNKIYTTLEKIKHEPDFQDLIKTNLSDKFNFPSNILKNLSCDYFDSRKYVPDPKGLGGCRDAISKFYSNDIDLSENLIVTASTSESYQMIFQVMNLLNANINVGTNFKFVPTNKVLLPKPGYPLFEQLAKFNNLETCYYSLDEKNDWKIDIESIKSILNESSETNAKICNKFLVLISPNNPTGSKIENSEFREICELARKQNLIVIVDEVFSIFQNKYLETKINPTLWSEDLKTYPDVKLFFLNGISKMFALPDMKLAWVLAQNLSEEELEQFEIYNDTFLNANYLIQNIFSKLVESDEVKNFQYEMVNQLICSPDKERCHEMTERLNLLKINGTEKIKTYNVNSGIHRIINISETNFTEEEYVLKLLEEKHIFVHPGYFYELENKNNEVNLVISIL